MSTVSALARRARGLMIFVFALFIIEFLDEFAFGAREAAWPLIRSDLHLSYTQIGLMLSLPAILANFIEPILGIQGDRGHRRVIILVGGILFGLSALMTAASGSFVPLLLASILFFPSSGAFVSLSQSTLMDTDSTRHEQNMARWTLAGSIGVLTGSIILGISVAFGLGWRPVFMSGAILAVVLVIILSRLPFPTPQTDDESEEPMTFRAGIRNALEALRRGDVLRWLILLEFANLLVDILYGYLALYFVDVVGVSKSEAALAVSVWTVVGLLGNFLLIPLLERVRGLSYIRISALVEAILFMAFLLIPNVVIKLIILGALGLFNAGWYPVLQGQLYSSMPGQSGTVMAISVLPSLLGSLIPLAIGFLAEQFGLGVAIWALMVGPIVLLIGLPRKKRT